MIMRRITNLVIQNIPYVDRLQKEWSNVNVSVANELVAGQSSGPDIRVYILGPEYISGLPTTVQYGKSMLITGIRCTGIQIEGDGAIVSYVISSPEIIDLKVTTIENSVVAISNFPSSFGINNLPLSTQGNLNVNLNEALSTLGITSSQLPASLTGEGNLSIAIGEQVVKQLVTDIGLQAIANEENDTNGTNTYEYNPWNFSLSSNPTVRTNYSNNNSMALVQQNGARGYLNFYFYCYNPTSAAASADITVNLYLHLPTGGPSETPIQQFTFSTGTINPGSGAWVQVQPNLFWEYNSLCVIPQQQTGTTGTAIGVANPSNFLLYNAHYWSPPWDFSDDGFCGFWTITNTSVGSNPVTVQGGTMTIDRIRRIPNTLVVTFAGSTGYTISPPANEMWKIKSIVLTWTAAATQTDYPQISIIPLNLNSTYASAVLNAFFSSLSVTAGDNYAVDVGEYVQSRTNTTIGRIYVTEFTVNKSFEVYPNEEISLYIGNESLNTTITAYITYVEENI